MVSIHFALNFVCVERVLLFRLSNRVFYVSDPNILELYACVFEQLKSKFHGDVCIQRCSVHTGGNLVPPKKYSNSIGVAQFFGGGGSKCASFFTFEMYRVGGERGRGCGKS